MDGLVDMTLRVVRGLKGVKGWGGCLHRLCRFYFSSRSTSRTNGHSR